MARPEELDENGNPVDRNDYLRRMAEWQAANAPGSITPYAPAWQATDNDESQTNTPNDTNYNRRDVNAELASGGWKAWLLDQAKQKEAEWGWNPYDESDFMGVVRNMTNARNTQSDTYYLNEVLKNWEARNASQQGGSTGRSGGGGGSGSGTYSGGLAPPGTSAGWMPMFNAPIFEAPAPFVAPTIEQARAEPGYRFALETGAEAMENAAAAKGTLRTGGTLKDLIGFGNELGERNYGNVFNRALSTYGTNYGTSRDVYDRLYAARLAEYNPKKEEATTNNRNLMDQWLAKLRAATDIFSEGARD